MFLALDDTTVERLATHPGVAPATLQLKAVDLSARSVATVAEFVRNRGAELRTLEVRPRAGEVGLDLGALDLTARCPRLSYLGLSRGRVRAEVLAHPGLFSIELDGCAFVDQSSVSVGYDPAHASYNLERLRLVDCPITPLRLEFGPHSGITDFGFLLDEDCADRPCETFRFEGCAYLTRVVVRACASWDLWLSGVLPVLEEVELGAGRFGTFSVHNDTQIGSSAYARALASAL